MTWNNPHPLANPLNTRRYGNFNVGYAQNEKYISRTHNPAQLTVPNQDIPPNGSPEWYKMHQNQSLTVPNQDIPYNNQSVQFGKTGFISNRLFQMPDGSVIDFKTGRIFNQHLANQQDVRIISHDYDTNMRDWAGQTGPSMEELINNTDKYVGTARPSGILDQTEQIDPASAAYWIRAQEEAEKLKSSMTDEQKALISAFEAHFPKSRLIEEAKKVNSVYEQLS